MGLFNWLDEQRKKALPSLASYVDNAKKGVGQFSDKYNPLDRNYWEQQKQREQLDLFNKTRDAANNFYQQDIKPTVAGFKPDRGYDPSVMADVKSFPFVANLSASVLSMSPAGRDFRRGVEGFFQNQLPQSAAGLAKSRIEADQTNIPLLGPLSMATGIGSVKNPLVTDEQRARNIEEKQGVVQGITNLQNKNTDYIANSDISKQEVSSGLSKQIGGGVASMGTAVATTAVAGPAATFSLFGAMQKGQVYNQARDAGYSPEKADQISSISGGIEGGLEAIGSGLFLKKFGASSGVSNYVLNSLVKTGTEGFQEGSQQLGENFVAGLSYDQKRKLTEGVFDSFFVGALFGLAGGGRSGDIKTSLYQKALESGLDKPRASQFADVMAPILENKKTQLTTPETQEIAQKPQPTEGNIQEPPPAEPILNTQEASQVWTELDSAQAGTRGANTTDTGEVVNISQSSSFPNWIPSGYRKSEYAKKVADGLRTGVRPNGKAGELYDVAINEIKGRSGAPTSQIFASPNIEENLTFEQATARLDSGEHARIKSIFDQIDLDNNLSSKSLSGIGDWNDGAENTVYSEYYGQNSYEQLRKVAAQKGLTGRQKDVILFTSDPTVSSPTAKEAVLYSIETPDNVLANVKAQMDAVGIQYKTILPTGEGSRIIVFDIFGDETLVDKLKKIGEYYGAEVKAEFGKGEFLTNSETRAGADLKYRQIMGETTSGPTNQYQPTGTERPNSQDVLTEPTVGAKVTPEEGLKLKEDVAKISLGTKTKERGHITTLKESDNVNQELKDLLESEYTPETNRALLDNARSRIFHDADAAMDFALNTSTKLGTPQYTDEAVATGYLLIQDMMKKGNVKGAGYLSIKMAENLTAVAKTLQAARILNKMTPEGLMTYIDRTTAKNTAKPITEDQRTYFYETAKAIAEMPNGQQKEIARYVLMEEVADLIPSKMGDKLFNVWRAGLLTGSTTHLLNMASTGANLTAEQASRLAAVPVDFLISIFSGKRSVAATARGNLSGAKKGLGEAWIFIKTGYNVENILTKYEAGKHITYNTKGGKVAGAVATGVYRLLGSEDQLLYNVALTNSIYEQAIVAAKNKGLHGKARSSFIKETVAAPSTALLTRAAEQADLSVFHNKTALGNAAKLIQKIPLARVLVPFAMTPGAVATQIARYTPGTAVFTAVNQIAKGVKGQGFDQRSFSMAIGRNVIGAVPLLLGAMLYAGDDGEERISLSYPTNPAEQALWEATGKIPYSIKIGNKWYQLQAFGPQGLLIAVGAKYASERKKGSDVKTSMTNAMISIFSVISSQSMLEAIGQLFETIGTIKNGTPASLDAGSRYLTSRVTSIVPAISREVAEVMDPYKREANGLWEGFMTQIPGLREKLEIKRDVFGREITRRTDAINFILNPARVSDDIGRDMVTNEFSRLAGVTSEGKKLTVIPSREFTNQEVGDSKIKLTSAQLTKLEQQIGSKYTQFFGELMNTPQYASLDDSQKAHVLQDAKDNIYKAEKLRFMYQEGLMDQKATQAEADKLDKQQIAYLQRGTVKVTPQEQRGATSRSSAGANAPGMGGIQFGDQQDEFTLRDSKFAYDKISYKNAKDLTGYAKVSQAQYDAYEQQIRGLDPVLDLAKIYDLRRKQLTIAQDIQDIFSKGGFSGGGSGSKKTLKFAKTTDFGSGSGLSTIGAPSVPTISIRSKTGGASGPGKVATTKRRIGTL